MGTVVIGDVHGCGTELQFLLKRIPAGSQIVLVGDLFDRAMHGHLVWEAIKKHQIRCLRGNHEAKMLKWLKGERSGVPPHYVWAVKNLFDHGVKLDELVAFLEGLPTLLVYTPGLGEIWKLGDGCLGDNRDQLETGEVILVHAGVNPDDPVDQGESFTVYGGGMKRKTCWWDDYQGDNLVVYGHLSTKDCTPRIRMGAGGKVNSIGIDTSVAHGHALTGYVIETNEFISYKSGIDWASTLKERLRDAPYSNNEMEAVRGIKR